MRIPIPLLQGCQQAWRTKEFLFLRGVALFIFMLSISEAWAQSSQRAGGFPEVETTWPGVRFQIFRIERIPNRLVVAVRILATEKAPPTGTFLGTKTPLPSTATREDVSMGLYDPKPFSLTSAVMIDEQSGQRYPVLPSIAPPGKIYLPSIILASLMPGEAELLTIQFAAPPFGEGELQKRTASFLLPNAKAPITRVPIPPSSPSGERAVEDL